LDEILALDKLQILERKIINRYNAKKIIPFILL
jgi:hypothetical protein